MRAFLWLISSLALLQGVTLERLSLDDIIVKSTAIVRGPVTRTWGATTGKHIFTHFQVQVLQRWRGANASTVDVAVPGGQANGLREICPGAPTLAPGREYVLFLWTGKSGVTQIIGFTQGLFILSTDPATGQTMAVRPSTTETMLAPGTDRLVNDQPVALSLADLSARLAHALGSGSK